MTTRNPHAGVPFDASDDEIAEALLDVSVPDSDALARAHVG